MCIVCHISNSAERACVHKQTQTYSQLSPKWATEGAGDEAGKHCRGPVGAGACCGKSQEDSMKMCV